MKKFYVKATAIAFCLLALSTSAVLSAKHCHRDNDCKHSIVRPAQANYQDTSSFTAVAGTAIPFTVENFNDNVLVNAEGTIFEVRVPGLYALDAFLLLSVATVGDTVEGYITINDRQLLTFFESETRVDAVSPIVPFHFEDRLVYLDRGDRVSVVLTGVPTDTTVGPRGFVMINYNNTR